MRAQLDSFTAAYAAWIAIAVLLQFPWHLRFVVARGLARGRPALLGLMSMPRISAIPFAVTGVAFVAALLTAATMPLERFGALVVAAIAALLYFSQVIEIPAVRRKANTAPVILLLLAAALAARPDRTQLAAGWSILTIKAAVAQIYLSSGLMKLRNVGWRWSDGATLRANLVSAHLRSDGAAALALAARPRWCRAVATSVLIFELTFWLVIPFPPLAWIYLPVGLAFHVGTAVLMRIHYWIYIVPAYFVFVRI